jgi:hypothetical protein
MNEDEKVNRIENFKKKKHKPKKYIDEENVYQNKINKQFKVKKNKLIEEEYWEDYQDWENY